MASIFFSWQSDTRAQVGRAFIEKALEKAIKELKREATLQVIEPDRNSEVTLDKDTKGVPGSPPIFDTILKKIEACSAFVADLTYVGERESGQPSPNPNVLIEYGWALRAKGHERLIGVMNTAFGSPQEKPLPFDLRHSRNPIQYFLSDTAGEEDKKLALAALAGDFKIAIKAILDLPEVQSTAQFESFTPTPASDGSGRFRRGETEVGVQHDEYSMSHPKIFLDSGPVMWIRIWPKYNQDRAFRATEILDAIRASQFQLTLLVEYSSSGLVRGEDGFGRYVFITDSTKTKGVAYVFRRGEIWVSDVSERTSDGVLLFHEASIIKCFERNVHFYRRFLQMPFPLVWEAGIEGLSGLSIYKSTPDYAIPKRSFGPAMADVARAQGEIDTDTASIGASIRSFFEAVYDAFGTKPPSWIFND